MGVFHKKYAKKYFKDFVFASDSLKRQVAYLSKPEINGPLLLYGPSGSGKTCLAKVITDYEVTTFPKLICFSAPDEEQPEEARICNGWNNKVIIIDNVHFANNKIQQRISSAINRYEERGGYFVVCTTNNLSRVHPDLKSKCDAIHVPFASPEKWLDRVKFILLNEGMPNIPDKQILEFISGTQGNGYQLLYQLEHAINNLKVV